MKNTAQDNETFAVKSFPFWKHVKHKRVLRVLTVTPGFSCRERWSSRRFFSTQKPQVHLRPRLPRRRCPLVPRRPQPLRRLWEVPHQQECGPTGLADHHQSAARPQRPGVTPALQLLTEEHTVWQVHRKHCISRKRRHPMEIFCRVWNPKGSSVPFCVTHSQLEIVHLRGWNHKKGKIMAKVIQTQEVQRLFSCLFLQKPEQQLSMKWIYPLYSFNKCWKVEKKT